MGVAHSPSDTNGLLTAVAALSRTATGQFAVPDLLRRLVDLAAEHLDVDGAGVMITERSGGLGYVHASHEAVDRVERLQELMQQGPCRESVRELHEVAVTDLAEHDEPEWRAYLTGAAEVGLRSVVAIPLVSRGRSWGVLDLYRHKPGPWSEPELVMVRLLADVAASYVVMALDRDEARQAQHQLAHRSLHDELTGLPNRTLLFDRLEHALTAAARHHQTVAVFFIDLDRFKKINDTFGHAAGDAALIAATRRIAATLREEDTLARLAGDEFVLVCELLPQRTPGELERQLRAVTERIHTALSAPIRIGSTELALSASIGVALSAHGSTADDLLAEADAAMYRAK